MKAFKKIGLVLAGLIYGSILFASDQPCEHFLTNTEKQQNSYMMMHESDYHKNKEEWEVTLYRPLRDFFKKLLLETDRADHFVYVAPGPRAPLFEDGEIKKLIQEKVKEITFVEISQESLDSVLKVATELFPGIKINLVQADITMGFSNLFSEALSVGTAPEMLSQSLKYNSNSYSLDSIFQNLKIPKAHLIYSEMVATFTGVAAVLEQEKKSTNIDEILTYWKRFNELSYLTQVFNFSQILENEGTVAIATDTLKVFDNSKIESRPSFTTEKFPELSEQIPLAEQEGDNAWWLNADVWWRDENTSRTEDEKTEAVALLPHRHKVEFRVYKR